MDRQLELWLLCAENDIANHLAVTPLDPILSHWVDLISLQTISLPRMVSQDGKANLAMLPAEVE